MWTRYGRINRATYFLCLAILTVIWGLASVYKVRIPGEILVALVAIPRLHDIGKSAWWAGGALLLEIAVVFVALPFAISAKQPEIVAMAGGLLVVALWGVMILLGCIRGNDGVNKYGAPPPPGVSFKTYRMTKSAAEAEADAF